MHSVNNVQHYWLNIYHTFYIDQMIALLLELIHLYKSIILLYEQHDKK